MTEHPYTSLDVTAILVKTMALTCVRNTRLEDVNAGLVPLSRAGDYSDVTVTDADGRRIPWPEVSHFDDDAMRDVMRHIVDRLYTFQIHAEQQPDFLERITRWMQTASRWNDLKLDDSFLADRPAPLDAGS